MVSGFNIVLDSMFPAAKAALEMQYLQQHQQLHPVSQQQQQQQQQLHGPKTMTLKEAAKKRSEQVKAQAEQIYQTYSVKNWIPNCILYITITSPSFFFYFEIV